MRTGTKDPRRRRNGMEDKVILLVEDNPDDEILTLRALRKNGVTGEVVVARDGVEALEYLFGVGEYSGRDTEVMPQLILLDLKLPKVDGLEVLRRLRADERTRLLPVVVFGTARSGTEGCGRLADAWIPRDVDFDRFVQAVGRLKPLLNRAGSPRSEGCASRHPHVGDAPQIGGQRGRGEVRSRWTRKRWWSTSETGA
jgi:two-component system response regulator